MRDHIIYKQTETGPMFMTTFLLATMTAKWTDEYPDAGLFTDLQALAITDMVPDTIAMKAKEYGSAS